MMTDSVPRAGPDAARIKVWVAFANHFLDTETRQDVPLAALTAVEGGFTIEEARAMWRFEVAPVVGPNLLSVLGEWAGWNEEWLVSRCSEAMGRRPERPETLAAIAYRFLLDGDETWTAIERCMRALLAIPADARRGLAQDLCGLANHYFDFDPRPLPVDDPARLEELRRHFEETFLPTFRPLVSRMAGESPELFAERVERAFRGEAKLPRKRP
jgi:hypothetical protein